ncbi:MAG: ABC transporter permease [Candidatus Izemoplasmataceae bacterium]
MDGLTFMEIVYFIFPLIIASAVPLTLVATGALYSERSGVVNIALEGIMLMGAYVGSVTIKTLESSGVSPLLNLSTALIFGLFIGYVLYLLVQVLLNKIGKLSLFEHIVIRIGSYVILAVFSTLLMYFVLNASSQNVQVALVGLLVGAIVGIGFSLFHAYASINMKANQIISATALNMFAPAFAIFINRTFSANGTQKVTIQGSYRIREVPFFSDIPIIGDLFFKAAYLSTYLGIVIFIVAVVVLYKTKFGLRLRSCGENPHAADSLGINIYKIRYSGVMVSGALAGMGGVIFVLSFAANFNATVSGFGFLALAVLIFGNWKPKRIILAALFFASMRVIANTYSVIPALKNLNLDGEIYSMLPYVATLVVLAFVSKNSAAPLAAGEPFDPGKR